MVLVYFHYNSCSFNIPFKTFEIRVTINSYTNQNYIAKVFVTIGCEAISLSSCKILCAPRQGAQRKGVRIVGMLRPIPINKINMN